MKTVLAAALFLALALPGVASAQTPMVTSTSSVAAPAPSPTPKPVEVTGSVEGGVTATSGDTDVQTWNGALKAAAKAKAWKVLAHAAGIYAKTRSVQTAGSWEAALDADRTLSGVFGLYAKLSIDGDRFKGVNNRKGAGAGVVASKAWRAADAKFDHDTVRGGVGYQYYLVDLAGTTKNQDIRAARVFAGYTHAFTKETVFSEDAEALDDFVVKNRFLVNSTTALTLQLRTNLAVKMSEVIKDDTVPDYVDPNDPTKGRFHKVNTLETAAFIYSF